MTPQADPTSEAELAERLRRDLERRKEQMEVRARLDRTTKLPGAPG
jgi:hypothetical protein